MITIQTFACVPCRSVGRSEKATIAVKAEGCVGRSWWKHVARPVALYVWNHRVQAIRPDPAVT